MSTSTPTIELPPDLRPSDGRFGSGPSKVRPEAVAHLAEAAPHYLGTSHRKDGVRSVVRRVREGITNLLGLPDGYEVLLGNGGTTVFWDAAVFGLIERHSQHLAFGEFSSKFAGVVAGAPHLEPPEILESAPGTHPATVAREDVDFYALTHNETSTGVMMEIRRPFGTGGLIGVDATSAAGGLLVDAAEFDVYYFAPQKCLSSDGGLWLAACSPAAIERIERVASSRWIPPSISLATALENSRLDQTYNTPALATLFLLAEQVDWLNQHGGLEWAHRRCDTSAQYLYRWADASNYADPFVADPAQRSSTVATIDFGPRVDANELARILRANGILDTESYRKLGRNQLRVAVYPSVEPDDVQILTKAIDHIVANLP